MPPLKKHKTVKEEKTTEEQKIQSILTSSYNIFIPGYKAKYIRVRNPLTGLDPLFSVEDAAFFELFYELAKKGLEHKMMSEIEKYAFTIDPDWQQVYESLQNYLQTRDNLIEDRPL